MLAAIYARYSDHRQKEESIEAQLKICNIYAKEKGFTVVSEYTDRALTGLSDDRPQFQKMFRDAEKGSFNAIIVYALNRFARDRDDYHIYKKFLKNHGIQLLSVTDNIPEGPSGILLESVLVGQNEYYSVELSQKVKRNMILNAEKCLSNGGRIPLGYKLQRIDPYNELSKKKYVINEETAPIVKEIFMKYANGATAKEICDSLNARQLKTSQRCSFNKSSLHAMLKNKKYIGYYTYDGKEIPNGIPPIIEKELFDKVAKRMEKNKKNPAHSKAKVEYLLTTKLFCGHCKEKMIGHSSNKSRKNGLIYNYYKCKNSGGSRPCKKKMVQKDYMEDIVFNECLKLLNPRNIRRIAKEVVKISQSFEDKSELILLKKALSKAKDEKSNQIFNLRKCSDDTLRSIIFEDLSTIQNEIEMIEHQIKVEESRHQVITEKEVIDHLTKFTKGNINDVDYRKALIDLFVDKIYLYDDKFTITFNTGDESLTISDKALVELDKIVSDEKFCLSHHSAHQKRKTHH